MPISIEAIEATKVVVCDFFHLVQPGGLADKEGMKKVYLGIIIFILASLLYPFVPPKLLIHVRFLQGVDGAALPTGRVN